MLFKKYVYILNFIFTLTLLCSCMSSPKNQLPLSTEKQTFQTSKDELKQDTETKEKILTENDKILLESTIEQETKNIENEQLVLQNFIDTLRNLSIKTIQSPTATIKGKPFNKDFIFQILDNENNPVIDQSITLRYPIAKENDSIFFQETILISDAKGFISFSPKETDFSCNSFLYLYPVIEGSLQNNAEIEKIIQKEAYKTAFQIKTNLINAGGSLCLADYDKNNSVVTTNGYSTSALLGSLIRNGFTGVGNLEFYKEIDAGNTEFLLQQVKKLTGAVSTYFIYGRVKYARPPEQVETNKYEVELECEIFCVLLKTNEEIYKTKITVTGFGNTETAALNDARNNKMNAVLAEKIIYGM